MHKNKITKKGLLLALGLVLLALPYLAGSYYLEITVMIVIYVMLAITVRACLYSGMFTIGHSAFMGVGAYTSTLLMLKANVPFPVAFICSGLLAAVLSLGIGYPSLRFKLRGMYFALLTMSFVLVVSAAATSWVGLTRGPAGIADVPSPSFFGFELATKNMQYYWGLLLLLAVVVVFYRLEHSRIGMIWKSIGQNHDLSETVGIHTLRHSLLVFAVSSFFAGLVGSYYAHYIGFIDPGSFGFMISMYALVYVWIGGRDSFIGPVIGALFLTLLKEPFRGMPGFELLFFGLLMMLTIMFLPEGLVSLPGKLRGIFRRNDHVSVKQSVQAAADSTGRS